VIPSRFITYGGILYRITVQAKINGRGLDFLLDSGSDRMTIDPGVAHELGMTPFGRAEHMSMGALNMDADVLSTTPYTEDPDGKSPIVGLMGFPFSASGIVGIDFKAQTVTIYPRSTFDPKALGLVALPISFDDDLPRFLTNVEGVQASSWSIRVRSASCCRSRSRNACRPSSTSPVHGSKTSAPTKISLRPSRVPERLA
jgi:hypothetical protein